jgi:hypothetical protein
MSEDDIDTRSDGWPLNAVCPSCNAAIGQSCSSLEPTAAMGRASFHVSRIQAADRLGGAAGAGDDVKPKRVPVDYRYDAVLPDFLKMLAKIGAYADEKYGSWSQYMKCRLEGEKAPLNHIREHLRQYEMGEAYDHFDGDPRWHLAAVAYNAMMEFWYHTRFGHVVHPSAKAAAIEKAALEGGRT